MKHRTFQESFGVDSILACLAAFLIGICIGIALARLDDYLAAKRQLSVQQSEPVSTTIPTTLPAVSTTSPTTSPVATAPAAATRSDVVTTSDPVVTAEPTATPLAMLENYKYRYGINSIPSRLPDDYVVLEIPIRGDIPLAESTSSILSEFTSYDGTCNYTITANPSLPYITERCALLRYQLVAVYYEMADRAGVSFFVMNPCENSSIVIREPWSWEEKPSIKTDVMVCELSFFSRTKLEDGSWQSDGVELSDYNFWGVSVSGNTDYQFGPTGAKYSSDMDYVRGDYFAYALNNLAKYVSYWDESSGQVLTLQSCFNENRSALDLDRYATYLGYTITAAEPAHRAYVKGNRGIDIVAGEVAIIEIVEPKWHYYAMYYTPRIDSLPDEITISGGIVLNERESEQLSTVLGFLDNAEVP